MVVLYDTLDNRYTISRLLDRGGMAEIFLARDRVLDREVALKILGDHQSEDTGFIKRFRNEARSVAALNHPNVVQVYDQGRSPDGRYFIAMEHVDGGNLRDRIQRDGPLDPAEAARLASQIALALQAAHERGIIHRDVKPQNVLLDGNGNAKVADFGIALAAEATTAAVSDSGTHLVFGTAAYMSPQQAMGQSLGPESDLYSLGVVLYEMLTGELPFETEGGPLATAMKHVTEAPRPPRSHISLVPEGMEAVVMALLAKNPENRYASAAELAEDLRRVREGMTPAFAGATAYSRTVRTPVVATAPIPGNRRRWRKPMATGLVALAALLALLGGFVWDPTGPSEGMSAVRNPEAGPLAIAEDRDKAQDNDGGKDTGKVTGSHTPSESPSAGSNDDPSVSASTAPSSAAALPVAGVPDAPTGERGAGGSAAQEQYR